MNTRQIFLLAESICRKQQEQDSATRRLYFLSAVGVRPDGLVVSSYNTTLPERRAPEGHAEYRLHSKLISKSVVYVLRLRVDGTRGLAKPCPRCESLLRIRRVKRVYYTINDAEYGVMEF